MAGLLADVADAVAGAGVWAPLMAFLFTSTVAVLPLPAEVPAALNGVLFGPVWGAVLTWTGAMAGACLSYEAGRQWGHPLVRRILPADRADRAASLVRGRSGGAGLLILRLVPVVAFTLVNWGAGLVGVPRRTYLWTTASGIVPGVMLFTGGGSVVVDVVMGMRPSWTLLSSIALAVVCLLAACAAFGRTQRSWRDSSRRRPGG